VISFLRLAPDGTVIMTGAVPEGALQRQRELYPDLIVVESLTEWEVPGRKVRHQVEIGDKFNRATGKVDKRRKALRKRKKG
jgi:hypothetical protein